MRDPERIARVLSELGRYWASNPDLRLGQILGNFGVDYYTEDERILDALKPSE